MNSNAKVEGSNTPVAGTEGEKIGKKNNMKEFFLMEKNPIFGIFNHLFIVTSILKFYSKFTLFYGRWIVSAHLGLFGTIMKWYSLQRELALYSKIY